MEVADQPVAQALASGGIAVWKRSVGSSKRHLCRICRWR